MYLHQPTKRDQSGFSVIEALLAVLVVAVLAVICLVVYQHHKSIPAKSSAAANTTQTTTLPTSTTTTQPAQVATQYLTIKEWGVKLPLSSTISDAYYSVGGNVGTDGKPNTIWLGLTSLNSSGCNASPDNPSSFKPLGAIVRVLPTDKDPGTGKLYTQQDPNGTTINGYYYGYASNISKDSSCASATTLQSIDSAFAAAAKGIVTATDPNYLVIKEWGIKIKLADADKITYTLGGNPNGSTANADAIVSWATLKLNSSVNTSDKCRLLGYEAEQLTAGTGTPQIGKYDYGFSGTYDPCGDSSVDPLRAKITGTELVNSAITAE